MIVDQLCGWLSNFFLLGFVVIEFVVVCLVIDLYLKVNLVLVIGYLIVDCMLLLNLEFVFLVICCKFELKLVIFQDLIWSQLEEDEVEDINCCLWSEIFWKENIEGLMGKIGVF